MAGSDHIYESSLVFLVHIGTPWKGAGSKQQSFLILIFILYFIVSFSLARYRGVLYAHNCLGVLFHFIYFFLSIPSLVRIVLLNSDLSSDFGLDGDLTRPAGHT